MTAYRLPGNQQPQQWRGSAGHPNTRQYYPMAIRHRTAEPVPPQPVVHGPPVFINLPIQTRLWGPLQPPQTPFPLTSPAPRLVIPPQISSPQPQAENCLFRQITHIGKELTALFLSLRSCGRRFAKLMQYFSRASVGMKLLSIRIQQLQRLLYAIQPHAPPSLQPGHADELGAIIAKNRRLAKMHLNVIQQSSMRIETLVGMTAQLKSEIGALLLSPKGPTAVAREHAMVLLKGIGGDYNRANALFPRMVERIDRINRNVDKLWGDVGHLNARLIRFKENRRHKRVLKTRRRKRRERR